MCNKTLKNFDDDRLQENPECKTEFITKFHPKTGAIIHFFHFCLFQFKKVLQIINISLMVLNITLIWSIYYGETRESTFICREVNDSRRLLNMNDFEYIISKKCESNMKGSNSTSPSLVILIHTSPLHFESRKALRETWLYSDKRVLPYFMLGKTNSKAVQNEIIKEEQKHHDLIQGNFIDSYYNLTYKHTMLLKWFSSECNNIKYLVKMDDDVLPNLPEVFSYLDYASTQNYSVIGGFFWGTTSREGKYKATQEQLKHNYIPESAWGPSIIYSSQFARDAYEKSHTTRIYWQDDIFVTGFIRQQLHIKLTDIRDRILDNEETHNFNENAANFSIPNFLFSGYALTADELYKIWKKYETFRRRFTPSP